MTIAAVVLGAFQLPFVLNIAISVLRGASANENPWEATTLEWQASSPPPAGNFATLPQVHRGAYDYSVTGHPRDYIPQGEPA